jgi:hypothetical protein
MIFELANVQGEHGKGSWCRWGNLTVETLKTSSGKRIEVDEKKKHRNKE